MGCADIEPNDLCLLSIRRPCASPTSNNVAAATDCGVTFDRDELLNESLFFGFDHARSAIAERTQDLHTARPHFSLGYQTPAAFAGALAATGSDPVLDKGFPSPPVAQPAPHGVTETAEALIAAG
ncbi:hypothetical protein EMQ25_11435 [Arsenicitalea aurantiaca]|uniref:Integrase catalytic domain-containing protein n=1 Tax=Arsenicitalea aurantiaca TaxID=1783274 RepID=A0A433X8M3_9HYPH|nr:hypothetical protein EMQ25_11435 [Arsenicitalea aurantiaca]